MLPDTLPEAVAAKIATARGFIFDMDGTIALGNAASGGHEALPGAIDLLATLRRRSILRGSKSCPRQTDGCAMWMGHSRTGNP